MNTYISPLSSLLLLLLLSTVTTAHDTPVTTPSVAKRRHAMGMRAVRDGVAIARLSDVSNSAQLLAFAGGALKTSDPRAARNYYLEAMRLAASMPLATPNNERVSVQDSVVAGIAELDPLYAMELFRQIDKPDWTAHPEFDMRSRTAAVIARVLFAKTGISKTDDLISLLSYAGDTGQYPYRAADQVISILEQRRQTSRINRMFSDALRHLEDDDTFVSSPAEFSDLLLAHAKVLPNSLCVRAVRAAVDSAKRLDRKYAEGLGQSQRTMIFTSENLQLKVKSQATYVSLRLLPLASRLDSRLADELRHNDPDLHAATSGLSADKLAELANGRGNVMIGSPDPKSSVQVSSLLRDQEQSSKLLELSQRDPGKAISGLVEIKDIAILTNTRALIARNLIRTDPSRASALLSEAWKSSSAIKGDFREHSRILALIADTWSQLNDSEHVKEVVAEGLAVAEAAYASSKEKDKNDENFLLRPGVDEIARFASILANTDSVTSLDIANGISDPEVKAYVLISIGNALLSSLQDTVKPNLSH